MSNTIQAYEAQKAYCDRHHLPIFVPSTGWCYACGGFIFGAIDAETAGKRLITCCPYCHTSFTD